MAKMKKRLTRKTMDWLASHPKGKPGYKMPNNRTSIACGAHAFADLCAGRPVDAGIIEEFFALLLDRGYDPPPDGFSEECAAEVKTRPLSSWEDGLSSLGVRRPKTFHAPACLSPCGAEAVSAVGENKLSEEEMAEAVLADINEAVTVVMRHLARAWMPECYDSAVLSARAEQELGRPRSAFLNMLIAIQEKVQPAVVFAALPDTAVRVGVSIAIPLTEDAFFRFREGELFDGDLTTDDVHNPSKYILILAADDVLEEPKDANKRSNAQLQAVACQIGLLCGKVAGFADMPTLISIAGSPTSDARLRGTGFSPVIGSDGQPVMMPRTCRVIYEVAPGTPAHFDYTAAIAKAQMLMGIS